MSFEYSAVKSIGLFLAGLMGAGLGLRLFLKWRYATALARARRAAARLRAPATTLSAVEDRSAALEELIEFSDSRAATAAVREVLGEHDDTIRSAAIEVLRQTRALDAWRRDLRRGSFRAKLRAIEALGEVGDERAVEELLEALGDDDPDIARAASRAICARDTDYACERLADALSSPNRRLAETAAAGLVHMGEDAVDYLVGSLGSLHPQARRLAAESLGGIGGDKLKDVLLPLLSIDPDPEVRAAAAASLARVDGQTAVAEIQRLARSDPDWFVRARAYSLLAEMEAEGATQYLFDGLTAFEPELAELSENGDTVESLTEGSRRVRRAIVSGLRMLGFTEDEIAAAERGGTMTSLSAEQMEEASAAAALLGDRDAAQRAEGVRRLTEIGTAAAEPLAAALRDPDPMVRAEIARSLGRIGSRDSLGALAECLKDPDPNVRLAASTALRAVVTREAARELTD
ncbi:MAG TPA: HEAT repeat domain-containing protein [Armatimonadota bacterium]|nr:HEAT repeat domain-containing protein [Armatimonadota bacterium]